MRVWVGWLGWEGWKQELGWDERSRAAGHGEKIGGNRQAGPAVQRMAVWVRGWAAALALKSSSKDVEAASP